MNRANLGPGFTSSPVESQCASSACDQLWVIYQFCNTPSVSLCFECHLVMRLGLRGLIKRGVMHFILALIFLNLFTTGRCTTVYEYEPYNIPSDSFVANGPPMWVKHGSRLETSSRNLPSDCFPGMVTCFSACLTCNSRNRIHQTQPSSPTKIEEHASQALSLQLPKVLPIPMWQKYFLIRYLLSSL